MRSRRERPVPTLLFGLVLTAMLGGPFFVWLLVSRTHGRTIV